MVFDSLVAGELVGVRGISYLGFNSFRFMTTVTTLEQLQTDLLADYKKVRPVLNWTETVDVQVVFSLYQVKSLVSNNKFSFALVNCVLSY